MALIGCFPALLASAATAQDYDENPSGRSIYALGDLRLTLADGERSWIDGGFGKGRFGGGPDGDARLRARAAEGALVWQPHFSFALDATIAAVAQHGQDQPVDLSEALLRYRPAPFGAVRVSAKLGLFWPPISLEHGGPAWSVTETITPSAINSWVGEEVKVAGLEATATAPLAGGRLAVTVAAFGLNDTSGTLLSFRGWALHDQKATAFSLQPLPPLDPFMRYAQAPRTRSALEIDNRPGVYAKLGWSNGRVKLSGFYYDNRGDPEAVNASLQWGWRTRFGQVAAQLHPAERLTLTAQAMAGSTRMGFPNPSVIWVDTGFRAAFLLATRRIGERSSLSARAEAFGTRGRGSVLGAQTSEDGWAATLAGRRQVGNHLTMLGEVVHVDSKRAERTRVALPPRQEQTIAQVAARVTL